MRGAKLGREVEAGRSPVFSVQVIYLCRAHRTQASDSKSSRNLEAVGLRECRAREPERPHRGA